MPLDSLEELERALQPFAGRLSNVAAEGFSTDDGIPLLNPPSRATLDQIDDFPFKYR